jgi:hypothetical protein
MFIYVAIYLMLGMLAFVTLSRHQLHVLFALLWVFFVLFVGTRLNTGCDFDGYARRFMLLNTDYNPLSGITEPGYYLLTALVKKSGLDFIWVNVIGAAIFFFFLLRFASSHPRPLLLIALVYPLLIIQLSMSGLRQALAVAFLMGAFSAFMQGKRAVVVLFVLLASTFHQSAIILLPLAMMVGRRFSMWRVAGAIVVMLPVAMYLMADRLTVYQDRYIENIYGDMTSGGAIFRLGLLVLTALLFELRSKQMAALYPQEYPLMRVFSLVCFALVPMMLVNTVAVHRLIFYVVPMQAFMLAALPTAFFASKRAMRAAELVPLALYATYIVVWFSLSRHANYCYVPYDSYLF